MASKESSMLLELCGNTIESLEWIILEQKLQFARCSHVAFIIPEEVADLIPSEEGTYCEIGYQKGLVIIDFFTIVDEIHI